MARPYPTQADIGAYVPTSEVFDPAQLNDIDINSSEFRDFLNILTRAVNDINLSLNIKDTGQYPLTEFINSQNFFPNPALSSFTSSAPILRNVFRKVINFGLLPDFGTTSVAHGIDVTAQYTFTRMYGCSSIPGASFVAIPNQDIKLTADNTNVTIQTFSAYTGYTTTYVILEYIKS